MPKVKTLVVLSSGLSFFAVGVYPEFVGAGIEKDCDFLRRSTDFNYRVLTTVVDYEEHGDILSVA